MIRFLIIALMLFLYLLLGIPVLLVEWIIGKFNQEAKDYSCLRMVQTAFKLMLKVAGVRLTVIGEENVPKDQAVLYIGNHRSYFDIVLTYSHFPGITGYVAKKEMLRYPLLKNWMKAIHCLFLDRDNIKEGLKTILKGVEEVKNGTSLCIFPEGTRNRENDTFLPFHDGSFKIAEKGGVPVVPMVLLNSAAIFEDHLPRIRRATVVIEFQKPVFLDRLDKSERKKTGTYVSQLIKDRYFELKQEYMGLSHEKP